MTTTYDQLAPRRILLGHVSPDTAYVVDDYPYGFKLRCQIRYWIATAVKGARKGQQCFVSQTTNPKKPGEVWNNPKPSTYTGLMVMFLAENGHVHNAGISHDFGLDPQQVAIWQLTGLLAQLDPQQRAYFDAALAASRRYAEPWEKFDAALQDIRRFYLEHGQLPTFDGLHWQGPTGQHFIYTSGPVLLEMVRRGESLAV